MANKYIVVEQSGYNGEKDVREFDRYEQAVGFLARQYMPSEIETLHVEICVEFENGDRSYEI